MVTLAHFPFHRSQTARVGYLLCSSGCHTLVLSTQTFHIYCRLNAIFTVALDISSNVSNLAVDRTLELD